MTLPPLPPDASPIKAINIMKKAISKNNIDNKLKIISKVNTLSL